MRKKSQAGTELTGIYKGARKKKPKEEGEVAHKGRVNGIAELPATTDQSYDYYQRELIGFFKGQYTACKEETGKSINNIKRTSEQFTNRAMGVTLVSIKQEVLKGLGHFHQECHNRLEELAEIVSKRKHDLTLFMIENNLSRLASESKNKINTYLAVVLLLLLEAGFNSAMYGEGSSYGIIGGALTALLVSGINVSSGILVGAFVLKYCHHVKPTYRLYGYIASLVSLGMTFSFHLYSAFYRDSLANLSTNQTEEAVAQSGLSFAGLVMVAVGMLIWVLSIAKGYYMSDRYIGYGEVSDNLKEAKKRFLEAEEEAVNRVNTSFANADSNYQNRMAMVAESISKSKELMITEQEVRERFQTSAENLNSECNKFLQLYQESNEQARSTSAPNYFGQFEECFSSSLNGNSQTVLKEEKIAKMEKHLLALKENEEEFANYIIQLQSKELAKLNEELKSIKKRFLDDKEAENEQGDK